MSDIERKARKNIQTRRILHFCVLLPLLIGTIGASLMLISQGHWLSSLWVLVFSSPLWLGVLLADWQSRSWVVGIIPQNSNHILFRSYNGKERVVENAQVKFIVQNRKFYIFVLADKSKLWFYRSCVLWGAIEHPIVNKTHFPYTEIR